MSPVEHPEPIFHGFRGAGAKTPAYLPPLTVTISKETGSRGVSIAKRAAELLGWQFIDQERLEYIAQSPSFAVSPPPTLEPEAEEWVDRLMASYERTVLAGQGPAFAATLRGLLEIGALGESVVVGRGLGCVLPTECRLNIRLIAPESERIAFIAQTERLSYPEAELYVRQRDRARRRQVAREFGINPRRALQYDIVLNTSTLGVEGCAGIIAAAAREKDSHRRERSG